MASYMVNDHSGKPWGLSLQSTTPGSAQHATHLTPKAAEGLIVEASDALRWIADANNVIDGDHNEEESPDDV